MSTDLKQVIDEIRIHDTHEHMKKESFTLNDKPDIICEIFENYVQADLVVAGLRPPLLRKFMDAQNPDIQARFALAKDAWEASKFTGYGEASRLIASQFFGIEEISGESLAQGQAKLPEKWPAGDRLRILRDEAKLDHIQTDDFIIPCLPDKSGPEFFLYDLSWMRFCDGTFLNDDKKEWIEKTEIEIKDLPSLREAMQNAFKLHGACAISVKAQHAYSRTLKWQEVKDADAERLLAKKLKGDDFTTEERNALGDWCWARGVELAIEYNLPFKLHTGYHAGYSSMPVDWIRPGNLCPILKKYPKAKFVLMHMGYPYQEEMLSVAKHYPNVYVDLCWAWSINPRASAEFVRSFIHSVPQNKLFGYGGDTGRPRASVAYATQARSWLTRLLQSEINDGDLTETQAIEFAERILGKNQEACFDYEGTRAAVRERLASEA